MYISDSSPLPPPSSHPDAIVVHLRDLRRGVSSPSAFPPNDASVSLANAPVGVPMRMQATKLEDAAGAPDALAATDLLRGGR